MAVYGQTPSGMTVILSDDEERAIAKKALEDQVHSKINRGLEMRKAIYGSVGSAIGLAVGSFLAGMAVEWWRNRPK